MTGDPQRPGDQPDGDEAPIEPPVTPPPEPGEGPKPPRGDAGGPRRLTRSRRDSMISGVAGGVAEYFDVDSVLVRIAFVVLLLISSGTFLLLYIAAWIIMPVADDGGEIGQERGPRERRAARAPAREPRGDASRSAGVAFGILLILVGIAALIWTLDLPSPPWDVILSVLLVLVGLAIVLEARRGVHGGLVLLALALTAVLALTSSASGLSVQGGFGERQERVPAMAQLESDYGHAFGSMELDLRSLELPEGTTSLDVNIAFGELRLLLPDDIGLRVDGSTLFGSTTVRERRFEGVTADHGYRSEGYDDAPRRLQIDLTTVFGSATVR